MQQQALVTRHLIIPANRWRCKSVSTPLNPVDLGKSISARDGTTPCRAGRPCSDDLRLQRNGQLIDSSRRHDSACGGLSMSSDSTATRYSENRQGTRTAERQRSHTSDKSRWIQAAFEPVDSESSQVLLVVLHSLIDAVAFRILVRRIICDIASNSGLARQVSPPSPLVALSSVLAHHPKCPAQRGTCLRRKRRTFCPDASDSRFLDGGCEQLKRGASEIHRRHSRNNSRNLLVCARLTGSSVRARSLIRSW